MNPLTQFKKIPILPLLIALALVVAAPALATPPVGVSTEFIVGSATGGATFAEIDAYVKTGDWKVRIDTNAESDLYVVRNTFAAGGHTGWHTHPGPSLITVTVGTITAYEGDDPTCTPHVYPQGSTLIDPGGGHVHLLRNEGWQPGGDRCSAASSSWRPEGSTTPAPGNCPF